MSSKKIKPFKVDGSLGSEILILMYESVQKFSTHSFNGLTLNGLLKTRPDAQNGFGVKLQMDSPFKYSNLMDFLLDRQFITVDQLNSFSYILSEFCEQHLADLCTSATMTYDHRTKSFVIFPNLIIALGAEISSGLRDQRLQCGLQQYQKFLNELHTHICDGTTDVTIDLKTCQYPQHLNLYNVGAGRIVQALAFATNAANYCTDLREVAPKKHQARIITAEQFLNAKTHAPKLLSAIRTSFFNYSRYFQVLPHSHNDDVVEILEILETACLNAQSENECDRSRLTDAFMDLKNLKWNISTFKKKYIQFALYSYALKNIASFNTHLFKSGAAFECLNELLSATSIDLEALNRRAIDLAQARIELHQKQLY